MVQVGVGICASLSQRLCRSGRIGYLLDGRGRPPNEVRRSHQSPGPRWPILNLGMPFSTKCNGTDQPTCNGPVHLSVITFGG